MTGNHPAACAVSLFNLCGGDPSRLCPGPGGVGFFCCPQGDVCGTDCGGACSGICTPFIQETCVVELLTACCSGVCTDVGEDPSNCGTCSNVCGSGVCAGGTCCSLGEVSCNGKCCDGICCTFTQHACEMFVCADVLHDPNDCGGCGSICPPSTPNCCPATVLTIGGVTQGGSPTVEVIQVGSCTNVLSDPNNCGACGTACSGGQTCSNGVCFGAIGVGIGTIGVSIGPAP